MTSAPYRYLHLDVFTSNPLEGNQLAVFPDARGLSDATMQAVAREMAFSETTFVLSPEDQASDVRMRIFTPGTELPMAGHPTVGSAFALAREGRIPAGRPRFVFGLGIGPVPVDLEWQGTALHFAWMTQLPPTFGAPVTQIGAVAAALGLEERDVRETRLLPQTVSCGVPFLMVPLATRRAVDNAQQDARAAKALYRMAGLDEELPIFLFTTEAGGDGATAYSRMFAFDFGIAEDPATGSASGPLGCYLVRHGVVSAERARAIVSSQGVKMGRPSVIHISIGTADGHITTVKVGGQAVLIGEGTLTLPTAP